VPPLALVVDDDPAVLEIACRYLADAGFECVSATSSTDALALLEAGRIPQIMVIDVRLPDIPGPELAVRIHLRYPRIPVLFVSAWPANEAGPTQLEVLRWEFLQKPFTGDTLSRAARDLLAASMA
jgi:DNA-binding NtrC family response regulator